MPFTVDIDKMTQKPPKPGEPDRLLISIDIAKPPVIQIPHMDFPRVLYLHPAEPYKIVLRRNALHEVVQEERVPSEHLTRMVNDAKELAQAAKDGWVKEPYVAPPLPDPNANLYQST